MSPTLPESVGAGAPGPRELGRFTVPADHPALEGHFPGQPVVPGVVLLDEVSALLAAAGFGRLSGVPAMRFLRPVRPGETVTVVFDPPRLSATTPDGPALRGTVTLV